MRIFRLSTFEVIAYVILVALISIIVYSKVTHTKSTIIIKDTVKTVIFITPDQTLEYLKALRQCESNGRYNSNNGSFDGGYQIGQLAKIEVGYAILHTDEGRALFRQDSVLQEEVMIRLLQSQIRIMQPYIKRYANTNIGNYWITTSGILAMSHLCGPDATIKFLTSRGKISSKDGNNVHMTRYLQFNNFNLPIGDILKPEYVNQHLIKYLKQ